MRTHTVRPYREEQQYMYHFFALLFRMRNIRRWGLMRSVEPENLAEHSMFTSLLAHGLACIGRDIMGHDRDPERLAAHALLHDAAEIITGDMPTPVKYHTPELRRAYADAEHSAAEHLLSMLPESMRGSYDSMIRMTALTDDEKKLIHAADKLAAHIKCVEELAAGNREFSKAAAQTLDKLIGLECPELDYFIEHFLPSFALTLDEQE